MEESTRYLLIGGGPASVAAAQNIRERDPQGRIVLVGGEAHYPYDKPPLSKQYLLKDDYTADDASSKFDNFYPDNGIDLRRGVAATGIDRARRVVTLASGDTIRYEKLLLATGARPRRLEVPGSDLAGIFYLRTVDDAEAIRDAIQNSRRAVMVGAGFIGMEVAAACAQRGLEVTVVEVLDHPWARYASPETGHFLRQYYEARGVWFLLSDGAEAFRGDGRLSAVQAMDERQVAADFAVVGIGVALNTRLARDAGLEVHPREGVAVDAFLRTSDPNIWAAGDIAFFEDRALETRWHAEHHLNAKWQGAAAGAAMAGEQVSYDRVAYFWADVFDIHMILRGDPQAGRNTTVLGDRNGAEFVELYHDETGRLRMGMAFSHDEPRLDPISDKLEELIRARANVRDITPATFGS